MKTARWTVLAAVLAVAGAAGCGGGDGPGTDVADVAGDPGADVPDVPADVPAEAAPDVLPDLPPEADDPGQDTGPKPYLSARKVASKADLVGGDNAYGMVGRSYILENDRVRFLVQDAGTSVHLYLYGGNLIDADVRHPDGVEGNDQWREMFAIVGFRVCSSDKVEVLKDGSDGQEAIVRVTGRDVNTNMIAMLDSLAQPLDITLQNDYVLTPGSPWVTLRTTAINDWDTPLEGLVAGDFLSFGGAQNIFTMENGFGGAAGNVGFVASSGRGASYGYTMKAGQMNLPLVDASGTIGLLATDFAVPAKGQASFERYLVLGTGDIASVLEGIRQIRGETVPTLSGTVRDESGQPLAGARVTALAGEGESRHAVNQAIAGADGTFRMGVPEGAVELAATAPGRATLKAAVTVAASGATKDLAFEAPGRITFSVDEVDGPDVATAAVVGPVPGKASLVCLDDAGASDPALAEIDAGCVRATGAAYTDTDRWCELGMYPMGNGKDQVCTLLNSAHGTAATVPVKPGRYRIVASRGPEYEQNVFADVEVKAGQTTTVAARLYRSVDTAGWLSADFHQHTTASLDAGMPPWDKTVANLDEGVEIAAATEHDMLNSYNRMIAAMDAGSRMRGLNGDEVSVNTVGHFNLLGWTGALANEDGSAGDMYPFAGVKLFSGRTMPEVTAAVRSIPGVRLWQMNHPRDVGSGYSAFIAFDPTNGAKYNSAEPMVWDFDMMEVKGYLGTADQYLESADAGLSKKAAIGSGDIPTMRDWFGWLNLGHPLCAVSNSDSHFRNHGVGYGRNLLRVGDKTPDVLTDADIADAVTGQRVVVSHGPFLQVFAGGVERMGPAEALAPDGEGKVALRLKVQAPTWMDVSSLEVYANGRPLVLDAVDGDLVQREGDLSGAPLSVALPLAGQPAVGAVRADVDIVVHPAVDTWYVFVVRGAGTLWPVVGAAPLAYTNAVYVDVDGGGFKGVLQ